MNFIEIIVEEYGGKYSEDTLKKIYAPGGIATYQPKSGIINVTGSEIHIVYKEAGGVLKPTDPVRIILKLNRDYGKKLSIFPPSNFDYLMDLIYYSKGLNIPRKLKNQFSFRGDKELIKLLASDENFAESLINEYFFITIDRKKSTNLMLTPANGIADMDHFRKMVQVLKTIEKKIKNCA